MDEDVGTDEWAAKLAAGKKKVALAAWCAAVLMPFAFQTTSSCSTDAPKQPGTEGPRSPWLP